jgi:hypothetical protein
MGFGFDISDNNVVQPNKKIIEPVNIVDTTNPPDSGGGNRTDTDDSVPIVDYTDWKNVIPNYTLSQEAKEEWIENNPLPNKNYMFLGFAVLTYLIMS